MRGRPPSNERATTLLKEGIDKGAAGDLAGARLALTSVLAMDPRQYDAWYNLGNVHFHEEQYERAAACYRTALGIDPGNHPSHYQLGVALEAAGRPRDALAAYREAVRTSPNPGGQWGYRGMDFTAKAEAAVARLSVAAP
jgi:tetratricopeptide (TPR) repeat protein